MDDKSSLFVGDLSAFCEESNIHALFCPYGEIISIRMMKDRKESNIIQFAFVKYDYSVSAQNAMESLNGTILLGRPLRINWAQHGKKIEFNIPSQAYSSIHVTFISYEIKIIVNEEMLKTLFEVYGKVMDVTLKKSTIDKDIPRQSGYGFIHFSSLKDGILSAIEAVKHLGDITIDNIHYKSSFSNNFQKLLTIKNDHHHVVRGCNSSGAQLYFNSKNSTVNTSVLISKDNASINQQSNVTQKTSIIENVSLDDIIMMQTNSNQVLAASSTINKQDIIDPPQLQHNQKYTYEYQDFRSLGNQRHQHHHHHQQQYHHHHHQHQNHDHTLLLPANTYYSLNDKQQLYKTITTIKVPTFYYPQQFVTTFRPIHMANNYDSQQHYHHHQHNQQNNHDFH